MSFICNKCGTDKNVFSSPDCWYKYWDDNAGRPHYFCIYCLFQYSFNNPEHNDGVAYLLTCPHCFHDIFKVVHCITAVTRGIDDLLRDFECFKMVHEDNFLTGPINSLDDVLAEIKKSFRRLSMSLYNGYSNEGRVMVDMQKLAAVSRRFKMRPSTFEEYKTKPTHEIELFDWSLDDKCASCHAVINLYQCVNKSECSHICCLECFLCTYYFECDGSIYCPICHSYHAGALENYRTKQVWDRDLTVCTWQASVDCNTLEEAIERFKDQYGIERCEERYGDCSIFEAQPELFNLFKTFKSEIPILQ